MLPCDIDLANLADVDFVHRRRPFTSAVVHLGIGLGAFEAPIPRSWLKSAHRAAQPERQNLEILRFVIPRMFEEPHNKPPSSLREILTDLREFASDAPHDPELATAMELLSPARVSASALRAAEHQAPFVRSAVRAVTATSKITAEVWPTVGALLDRDERRVHMAVTPEAKTTLLAGSIVEARLDGRVLRSPVPNARRARLARRVELVPILGGPTSGTIEIDPADMPGLTITGIGYPLPGLFGALDKQGHPLEEDRLAVLLGDVRAEVLLSVRQPQKMSRIAELVYLSASRTTYHVNHLERAGLVARERQGSSIWVRRTSIGDGLVELLGR